MSTSALDNPRKEVSTAAHRSAAMQDNNVITLSNHPLRQQREYERLVGFLEGKPYMADGRPNPYWRNILYQFGEEDGDRAKEWLSLVIAHNHNSMEKNLELAEKLAPWVLSMERQQAQAS